MIIKRTRDACLALAFGTVLALTTPGTAFAQETEVAPDSVTVSAINTETDFELSPGETKTVDLSSAKSKQSAEISVNDEPTMAFYDAANTAPGCVSAVHRLNVIKVRNNCPTPIRVKVVMTGPVGAQDTACKSVDPGAEETFARLMVPGVTRIDRVENC